MNTYKKVVIVGGVAGGASTAARLRRLDEHAHIIMLEKGEYISFANCGLPYYIGDVIQDRQKLLLQTPEAMYERFRIDVRVSSEAVQIDPIKKIVRIFNKERGTYGETYDTLILSPGAKPLKPPIPGIESDKIFTLRSIPDMDRIKKFVEKQHTRSAAIIGGGYIGVEMAENLRLIGLQVTLIEAAPHILAPFDSDMVTYVEKELANNGIDLLLGDGVQSFSESVDGVAISLLSHRVVTADFVILAIGVAPDTVFLKDSGLKFGVKGHILVNERMQTNVENVYAVGDAVEIVDFVGGQPTGIALAGPANKQGRIAADNIAGLASSYKGSQGSAILKIFKLTAASTGLNERELKRRDLSFQVAHLHPNSHASYYPGATPLSLKLLFNEQGRILGAQAVGYKGVDKSIDVIATVIRFKGTAADLTELELTYAPPYSSAKDPVNMAGFIAENILSGQMSLFYTDQIDTLSSDLVTLIDVRTPLEFANGNIPGAVNIPVDDLRSRLGEMDKLKEVWIYCQVGFRGYVASRILSQHGFRVKNLSGGYKTYEMTQYKPALI